MFLCSLGFCSCRIFCTDSIFPTFSTFVFHAPTLLFWVRVLDDSEKWIQKRNVTMDTPLCNKLIARPEKLLGYRLKQSKLHPWPTWKFIAQLSVPGHAWQSTFSGFSSASFVFIKFPWKPLQPCAFLVHSTLEEHWRERAKLNDFQIILPSCDSWAKWFSHKKFCMFSITKTNCILFLADNSSWTQNILSWLQ